MATFIIIIAYAVVGLGLGYAAARSAYHDRSDRGFYQKGGECFTLMVFGGAAWPIIIFVVGLVFVGERLGKLLAQHEVGRRFFGGK